MVVDGHDAEGSEETDACAGDHRRPSETQPDNRQRTTRKLPETTRKPPETTTNRLNPCPLPTASSLSSARTRPRAAASIAATLGTTKSIVRYRLDKLRTAGKVARVGPDKGGHWKVLDDSATEPDPSPDRDRRSPR